MKKTPSAHPGNNNRKAADMTIAIEEVDLGDPYQKKFIAEIKKARKHIHPERIIPCLNKARNLVTLFPVGNDDPEIGEKERLARQIAKWHIATLAVSIGFISMAEEVASAGGKTFSTHELFLGLKLACKAAWIDEAVRFKELLSERRDAVALGRSLEIHGPEKKGDYTEFAYGDASLFSFTEIKDLYFAKMIVDAQTSTPSETPMLSALYGYLSYMALHREPENMSSKQIAEESTGFLQLLEAMQNTIRTKASGSLSNDERLLLHVRLR